MIKVTNLTIKTGNTLYVCSSGCKTSTNWQDGSHTASARAAYGKWMLNYITLYIFFIAVSFRTIVISLYTCRELHLSVTYWLCSPHDTHTYLYTFCGCAQKRNSCTFKAWQYPLKWPIGLRLRSSTSHRFLGALSVGKAWKLRPAL